MLIGLTGGSGSGKSIVSDCLANMGLYIIDCDLIAHDIIKKGEQAYTEVVGMFGSDILLQNGEIDRKKLGSIVFNDKEKLKKHTACTHRHITMRVKKIIVQNHDKNIVIDAPLLIEAGFHKFVDEVWAVYADTNLRINRIMQRDNVSYEYALNRIRSQMPWDELSSYADRIIFNDRSVEDVCNQVKIIAHECGIIEKKQYRK